MFVLRTAPARVSACPPAGRGAAGGMPAQGSSRSRAGASSRDLARLSERTGEGGVGELLCFVCGAGGRVSAEKAGGGGDGDDPTSVFRSVLLLGK